MELLGPGMFGIRGPGEGRGLGVERLEFTSWHLKTCCLGMKISVARIEMLEQATDFKLSGNSSPANWTWKKATLGTLASAVGSRFASAYAGGDAIDCHGAKIATVRPMARNDTSAAIND